MFRMRAGWVELLSCVLLASACSAGAESPVSPVTGPTYADIRPIFEAHCGECHFGADAESGLRLDTYGDTMRGGLDGPAVLPGRVADSPLWIRLDGGNDELEAMPEDAPRLPAELLGQVRSWIATGAQPGAPVEVEHWSFRPLARPEIPAVTDGGWGRGPIDAFVLANLEASGRRPAPPADPRTLLRRLHLDLVGLPPSPEALRAFEADPSDAAYERWVDALLDSQQFGVRWARHWLDLARYADSHGFGADEIRSGAWRYRDWVIDAVNRDLPFDEFTRMQIAGDLLDGAGTAGRIATGFHTAETIDLTMAAKDRPRFEAVTRQVNAIGSAWLGLDLSCARCHNHPYDPVSQREYYQLVAVMNRRTQWWAMVNDDGGETYVLRQRPYRRPTHVRLRGDYESRGEAVEPGVPQALGEPRTACEGPARRWFADWLVDAERTPLTARVAVNRYWGHLLGRGLVPAGQSFGRSGEPPVLLELMEWLAHRFVSRGWSRKATLRSILLSSTYRQASEGTADPNFGRQLSFQLEAEAIHDLVFFAADALSLDVGGPAVDDAHRTERGRRRRAVYIRHRRLSPPLALAPFDRPDGMVSAHMRHKPAPEMVRLALVNDALYYGGAEGFAQRGASLGEVEPGLGWMFDAALGRAATTEEMQAVLRLGDELAGADAPASDRGWGPTSWTAVARTLLAHEDTWTRR